jgi:hypothetical protein
MKLFIKYMVSLRCKMVVKAALDSLGLEYGTVELGEVEVKDSLTPDQRAQLKDSASNLKSCFPKRDSRQKAACWTTTMA